MCLVHLSVPETLGEAQRQEMYKWRKELKYLVIKHCMLYNL